MNSISRAVIATLAVAGLALTSACASPAETPDNGDTDQLTTVTFGTVRGALPIAALEAGARDGYFEEFGIDLKIEYGDSGAALVPGLVAGQFDFVAADPLTLLISQQQGLPLQFLSGFYGDTPDATCSELYVAGNSDIQRASDLEGKNVAVNVVGGTIELAITSAVEKDGGDPSKVNFVAIGFGDMRAAVNSGNADTAWYAEPLATIATTADGVRGIDVSYFTAFGPGYPGGSVVMSDAFAEKEDVVDRVFQGIKKSLEVAAQDKDVMRKAAEELFDMDEALASKLCIVDYTTDISQEAIKIMAEVAVDKGVLNEMPDIDAIFVDR